MTTETTLRIIEVALQVILVLLAGSALYSWKREMRGKDKYHLAKSLLEYVKKLRFLIYSKNESLHQVLLNDIFVNKEKFYNDQLTLVAEEKVLFDENIVNVFKHIDARADFFLPQQIRELLSDLSFNFGHTVGTDKKEHTYISLSIAGEPASFFGKKEDSFPVGIYELGPLKDLTIRGYFQKWEKLITELQKLT